MIISTFNGCYFTEIKVHPKNWKATGKNAPTMEASWYFYYRFYDPTVRDAKGKIKPLLVHGRGMNKYKTLGDRRAVTEALIKSEYKHLKEDGFNPITTQYMVEQVEEFQGDILPDTPFIEALEAALPKLIITHRTMIGIRSVIKGVEKAATQLRFHDIPIANISRKHIKKILDRCESLSSQWSAARFNTYRGYLSMLYKELVEQETVIANPVRDISKRVVIQKIKPVLDESQRILIDAHLKKVFPRFRMFVHLFFHSGGRKTELLQLKPGMVDLAGQKYKCLVKKRKKWAEVERTIKDLALPYWAFFLENCREDQFIFGPLFMPADKPMGMDMPSRYWERYVKDEETGLGIKVDFYALKHLNSTEVVDHLDEQAAAALNAHTSTAMVARVYDIRNKDRMHEKLKKVKNNFV